MGRPCTWTTSETLRSNQDLCEVIAPLRKNARAVIIPEDQELQEYVETVTGLHQLSIQEDDEEEEEEGSEVE